MAFLSLPCSTGSFVTPDMLKIRYFGVDGNFCTSSFVWKQKLEYCDRNSRIPSFRFPCCFKSQHGVSRNNKIEPLVSRARGDGKAQSGKGESNRFKNRFSLRLRPRLRLLAMRMKRASIESILNEVGIFVRRNIRTVAFSTSFSLVFGLCFMFLKLTALPPQKIVPYSELVTSLQNGSVAKVLVEEGSRRIYYNMNSKTVENDKVSGEESQGADVSIDKDINQVGSEDTLRAGQTPVVNKLNKFSRTRSSIPQWQYSTRKIEHDEKFLISLMREKGVTYSSAPQSVLMSMRSTLITVITLWIPLIPLMWLLYRQLSAANSPARKQKPNSQTVGFDDVQGVDSAKVELMEVIISYSNVYNNYALKVIFAILLVFIL